MKLFYLHYITLRWCEAIRTLTLEVDIKTRSGCRRGTDPIVCDTLHSIIVVSGSFDRLDAQHAAVRHVECRVTLTSCSHASATLSPVHLGCRVARRLAEEADDAIVGYPLVTRRNRHLRRIYAHRASDSSMSITRKWCQHARLTVFRPIYSDRRRRQRLVFTQTQGF